MQDRGLAAYISELIGTLLLTFAIGTVVTLYASTSPDAQTGSDFAVIGLVQGLALFATDHDLRMRSAVVTSTPP